MADVDMTAVAAEEAVEIDVYQLVFGYPEGYPEGPTVLIMATSMIDALSGVLDGAPEYEQYSTVSITALHRSLGGGSPALNMTEAAARRVAQWRTQ